MHSTRARLASSNTKAQLLVKVCPTGRSSSGCDWLPIQISLMKLIAFFFNDFRCRWTPSISYDSCDAFHIHFSWDWPDFFWTSCPCLWDFNPLVSQSEISTVQPSFFQGPKWKTEVRLSESVKIRSIILVPSTPDRQEETEIGELWAIPNSWQNHRPHWSWQDVSCCRLRTCSWNCFGSQSASRSSESFFNPWWEWASSPKFWTRLT